jgi:hypothetical protein
MKSLAVSPRFLNVPARPGAAGSKTFHKALVDSTYKDFEYIDESLNITLQLEIKALRKPKCTNDLRSVVRYV